jgi:smad nuclear-interacting protein 1
MNADSSPPRKRDRSLSPPRKPLYKPPPGGGDLPPPRRRSPPRGKRRRAFDGPPSPEPTYEYGKPAEPGNGEEKKDEPEIKKEKPDFSLSGKLQQAAMPERNGVKLKWMEPPDAVKPNRRWRLYPFKGDETLDPIPLHRKACFIFGRDRAVVDVPTDHPSCSKQHAVLQFRAVEEGPSDVPNQAPRKIVKPYLIDLGSTNGTFIMNKATGEKEKIDDSRYYELKPGDLIAFGFSSREYVLLHEELAKVSPAHDSDA